MSIAESATSYAALILADDGVEITSDQVQVVIKSAKVDDFDPIYTTIFAKALEGKDAKDLLLNIGSGNRAATVPSVRIRSPSTLPGFDKTIGAFILALIGTPVLPSKETIEVGLRTVRKTIVLRADSGRSYSVQLLSSRMTISMRCSNSFWAHR
jgi:ribosomal protein L12E/L44/L45/RPP1/RPP2